MAETKRGMRVQWEVLRSFCEEVLGAAGVPYGEARIVAASLVRRSRALRRLPRDVGVGKNLPRGDAALRPREAERSDGPGPTDDRAYTMIV